MANVNSGDGVNLHGSMSTWNTRNPYFRLKSETRTGTTAFG